MARRNISIEQSDFLEHVGFKPTYPDDEDRLYCIYELKIEGHPLLRGLTLKIDGRTIDVWCKENIRGFTPNQEVLIATRIFTAPKLKKLIDYLKKDAL